MSILFIHPSDELYGADRMLLEFLAALPDDVTPEVWLPQDLEHPQRPLCVELERTGVAVRHVDLPIVRRAYRRPRALLSLVRRTFRLRRQLAGHRPDLVYCTTSAAFLCAAAARFAGVPDVVGHLQEIWSRSDRMALGLLARACHRLIAISGPVAASAGPALSRRARVVANGTSDPKWFPKIGERVGPLNLVVASRWNGWKGHRTLLAAWERAGIDATLTIAGGPPLSGEAVDVPAVVEGLTNRDSVRIIGEVADIGPLIDDADVVIVPSDRPEPFGLVAIEAFAHGRPVIASAAGGLVEIVGEGGGGWLFPPGDVAALARVLAGLDRNEAADAGTAARERFLQQFTREAFAARWRAAVFGAATR
ncbi:MAG: glycosyltransferase family 4 protein [Jatrophihabitans sp.]|uniref:glycosyltransferase family 4 protein n=1 Tax=Jatrophihabitans sp. TaxID=1932789 RepID=UPI003F8173E8